MIHEAKDFIRKIRVTVYLEMRTKKREMFNHTTLLSYRHVIERYLEKKTS